MLEVAFVISVCQIVRLCLLPDTHKEWLRVRDGPSYIHLCLYGLPMEAPCLAERPRHHNFFLGPARPRQPSQLSPASQAAFFNITFNFFLEPARPVMDFARNACTGGGALQLETPVPHMCRKAANLG